MAGTRLCPESMSTIIKGRNEKGQFTGDKGHTANPGGWAAPKALREILAIGQESTPKIMRRLVDAAENHPDPNVWIPAAREALNRTFGKPKVQVEVIGGVEHRHFVLRAPSVMSSSEAWELKYGGPDAIDVTPARPADKPHALYEDPEPVAVVNEPVRPPVASGKQGHTMTPPVFDAGDAANWRGQTQLHLEKINGS
jgi:hypothetical protein